MLEQALATLIELNARGRAAALRLERATFASKLSMCEGFGFIEPALATALKAVNSERNRLAHELNVRLEEENVSALVGRFDPVHRASVEAVVAASAAEAHSYEAQASKRARALFEEGAPEVENLIAAYASEARAVRLLKATFLVLGMALGHEIQMLRYRSEFGDKIEAYRMACAIAEVEQTGATPASIREHLGLPEEPDPRVALGALFAGPTSPSGSGGPTE